MNDLLRAVADPTRRQMLTRLRRGPAPAARLGEGFAMSQPAISQHLKVLREAGLVESQRQGRQRVYRLRPQGLQAVHDWVKQFESFWQERLDALEHVLDDMEPTDG